MKFNDVQSTTNLQYIFNLVSIYCQYMFNTFSMNFNHFQHMVILFNRCYVKYFNSFSQIALDFHQLFDVLNIILVRVVYTTFQCLFNALSIYVQRFSSTFDKSRRVNSCFWCSSPLPPRTQSTSIQCAQHSGRPAAAAAEFGGLRKTPPLCLELRNGTACKSLFS